ncbi:MAG: hypothetical protein WC794_01655 [Candidatus Doudnabacteria bacterium]|jgi:hypothetical protein
MAETKPGQPPENRGGNPPDAGKPVGGQEKGLKSVKRREVSPDGKVVFEEKEYYEDGASVVKVAEKTVVKTEDEKKPAGEATKTAPESSADKKEPGKVEPDKEKKEEPANVGKEAVEALKKNEQLTEEAKKILEANEAEITFEINQKKTFWQKAGDVLRPGSGGVVAGIAMKTLASWALRKGIKKAAGYLGSPVMGVITGAAIGAGWEYGVARHSETKRLQSLDAYKLVLKDLDKMSSLQKVERYIAIKEGLKKNKIKFESDTEAHAAMQSFQAEFKALSVFVEEGKWKGKEGTARLEALLKVVKSSSGEAIAESSLPENIDDKNVPPRLKLWASALDKFSRKNKAKKAEKNPARETEVAGLLKKYHLVRDSKKIRNAVIRGAVIGGVGGYLGGVISDHLGLGQYVADVSGQETGNNLVQAAGADAVHHADTVRQVTAETLLEAKKNLISQHDVLPVKSSVWATVADYFHSRGIEHPSNNLINEGMKRISELNNIEITGHHNIADFSGFHHAHVEGLGSVQDVKMSGHEILKGFASLDDLVKEGGGKTLEAQAAEVTQQAIKNAAEQAVPTALSETAKTAAAEATKHTAELAAKKAAEESSSKTVGWLVAGGGLVVGSAVMYVAGKKLYKNYSKPEEDFTSLDLSNYDDGDDDSSEEELKPKVTVTETGNEGLDFSIIFQQCEGGFEKVDKILKKDLNDLSEVDFTNSEEILTDTEDILESLKKSKITFSPIEKVVLKKMQKRLENYRTEFANLRKQWRNKKNKSADISTSENIKDVEKEIAEISKQTIALESVIFSNQSDNWDVYNSQKIEVAAIKARLDKLFNNLGGRHPLAPKILEQYRRIEELYEKSYKGRRISEVKKYTGIFNELNSLYSPEWLLKRAKEKGIKEFVIMMAESYGAKRSQATPDGILRAVNLFTDKLSEQRKTIGFSDEDRINLPRRIVEDYEMMYQLEQLLVEYEQLVNPQVKDPKPPEAEKKRVPESKQEVISRVVEMVPALLGYSSNEALEVLKTKGPMGLAQDLFASGSPSLEDKLRALNGFCYDLESISPLSTAELKALDQNNVQQYDAAMKLKAKLGRFLEDWRLPLYAEAIKYKIIKEEELGGPEDTETAKKNNAWLDLLQENGGPLNALATSEPQANFLRRGVREAAKSEGDQRIGDLKQIFVDILNNDSGTQETPQQVASKIGKFQGELKILFGKEPVELAYKQAKKEIKKK